MRTVSTFIAAPSTTELTEPTLKTIFSPPASFQRSPWHSPAPYLFAGVAAMLGLIAFALVILACSYRKRSGDDQSQSDIEAGAGEKSAGDNLKVMPVFEVKIVVIMAGDLNPTFLATPIYMSSKGSSFGNKCEKKLENESEELDAEKLKEQVITMEVRDQRDEELQHSNGESSH
ncbi:protein GLUTAMINE DUMPER 2-like [Nicotiana tabacum]|uniref:Protein GLUTAMINE DUMPER 2-like n=1 Tax=Nicotiana tabacum TaxID=4097 RepID=A0A1S3YVY4_TOBAC|nr:PREDICTED: protein GLUTAMINE DUMPER 2-like [Nicotiana tabacum]